MAKILFATSNIHKVREANSVGKIYGIEFTQLKNPYPEIRDEDVGNVAKEGAEHVFSKIKKPVVVDDTGLFIQPLNGFPGPYSAYAFRKIGCNGILRLMNGVSERQAVFISAVGYCDKDTTKVFKGECTGRIGTEIKGEQKFGYDPLFIPDLEKKTFAEDDEMKHRVSHRRKAFERFCQWYAKNKISKTPSKSK